jgi:hypothetical protein
MSDALSFLGGANQIYKSYLNKLSASRFTLGPNLGLSEFSISL